MHELGLFGSHARSRADGRSDIDILVGLRQPTFDSYVDLKFCLEGLWQEGVDPVIADTLKQKLKPQITREVIHGKGL